ncbi:hypothetical protein [Nostoc phage NMeng1]|nr:hypothetical protein [Nostoc phage NMeng1]
MKWNAVPGTRHWTVMQTNGRVIAFDLRRDQAQDIAAAHNAYVDIANDQRQACITLANRA